MIESYLDVVRSCKLLRLCFFGNKAGINTNICPNIPKDFATFDLMQNIFYTIFLPIKHPP